MKITYTVLSFLLALATRTTAETGPLLHIAKTNQSVTLSWDSSISMQYTLLWSSNLTSWSAKTNITATSVMTRVTFPAASSGREFYQLSNQASPLRAEILLTNGTRLQDVVRIGFTAVSVDAAVVYATLRVWTNGGKTNTLATMDLRENPTNSVEFDSTTLRSSVPHYLQLEVCDNYGKISTGEDARWAFSPPVLVIPTNAISFIHPRVVGWKFVADLIFATPNGTWSCTISNASFSNCWSGTIPGANSIRISDSITDFTHSYPGDTLTAHIKMVSAGVTNTLVRTIPVDRRPMIDESLLIGQAGYLTNSGPVYGELYDLENMFLSRFALLGSDNFRLVTQSHTNYPSIWNSLTANPALWNTVRQYLSGDFGLVGNRMFVWSPGYAPLIGDTTNNLSVGFLNTMAPSNRMTFAALSGCNSAVVKDLVWPDRLERSELFEWGLNPRLGLSWKKYPFSLSSTNDVSLWEKTFWKKFCAIWFMKDTFGLGIYLASEAIENAQTLDDGVTKNPMFDYLVIVGAADIYCDEPFLTNL